MSQPESRKALSALAIVLPFIDTTSNQWQKLFDKSGRPKPFTPGEGLPDASGLGDEWDPSEILDQIKKHHGRPGK